jgi:hypothetical protein
MMSNPTPTMRPDTDHPSQGHLRRSPGAGPVTPITLPPPPLCSVIMHISLGWCLAGTSGSVGNGTCNAESLTWGMDQHKCTGVDESATVEY